MAPRTRGIRAAAAAALVVAGLNILTLSPAAVAAGKPCTIVGTNGDDLLRGTAGDDVICALGGDDKVLGLGGDDVLRGGKGDDVLRGGPGDDVVAGGRGDDRIFGQGGDDVVRGDAGDDTITGGRGNDRMGGFAGADTLHGLGDPAFTDDLRCGPNVDSADADPGDRVRKDCETAAQNDPPTDITLDPASIAENEFAGTDIGDLTTNDPDPGDEITFTLVPGAGSGDNDQVEIDGDALESAEEYDFEVQSELSVRVRATDVSGEFVEEALVVTITDVNDPPVAIDDDATTTEDTNLEMALTGPASPAGNDTDQDGDPLTVTDVGGASGGTVSLLSDALRFEPDENLCGPDAATFDYEVSDGDGGTDTGTVTVDITCVDDDPTAVDDEATVTEDEGGAVPVRANDVDPENDAITVTGTTQPDNGSVVIDAVSGNPVYTPDSNYCNDPPPYDTFDYTINGGDSATVRMTVSCVNDAPVATDDDKTTGEDAPLTFPSSDLTGNDTDVDGGDTLTVTAVSGATGGTAQLTTGSITFTPTSDLCAPSPAGFDYTVSDGQGGTDTGRVTVDVTCVDDAAVANDDSRTVAEDSGPTVFSTLLANDTDVEDDPISITAASQPSHGTTGFTSGAVTYTPDDDYCGPDSFTYTVNGGSTATVTVTVTCANDAPVVDLDGTTGGNGSTATFVETDPHTGDGVLIAPDAEITDVDDSSLEGATLTLTSRPDGDASEVLNFTDQNGISGTYTAATGVLALSGTATKAQYAAAIGSVRYDNTVNPPDTTDRIITVVVDDGDAESVSRTATVQVVPLNVPPVNTVPETATTTEDTPLSFTSGVSISVADADDANLDVEVTVTQGTFATSGTSGLTVSGNGTATVSISGPVADINAALNNSTYTPTTNYTGSALLTIVTDDGVDTDTDSVDITVTPVNDAPTASNLSAGETYTEDTTKDLVDIVVSDVDSASLTVTLTLSNPSAGSLNTGTSGAVTSTYVSGTGVWSATGALADLNTLLAGLAFTPAADFNGVFAISTSVSDTVAAPVTGSKTMTGIAVNDAPTSAAPGAQTTDEDVAKAITGMSVADIDGGGLTVTLSVTHGTLTLAQTTGLAFGDGDGTGDVTMTFAGTQANLNAAIGSVTFAPTANYNGPAALTFSVSDGVAPPVDKNVAITVTPVNDAPVADDESFAGALGAIGGTSLIVDDPSDGPMSVTGPRRAVSGDILDGDTDVDGDALAVEPGTVTSNDGGTVTVQADGDFVYLPDDDTGCGDGSDFFNYTITDGASPTAGTDVGTVSVTITDCVWYVDGSAGPGGDGRSNAPFDTFASLNGAGGAGDLDDAADYLFVYGGDTFTSGIVLETDQRLFGEPSGLSVGGTSLLSANAETPSNIRNTAPTGTGITLANGVRVRGVNAGQAGAGSVFGIRGVGITTAIIDANVTIEGNGIGFGLQGAAGGDVTVDANIVGNTGAAVSIQQRTSGTVTVNGQIQASGLNATVEAVNNTGATITFTGNIDVSGAAQTALDFRLGGTVNVTGPGVVVSGITGPLAIGVQLDGVTIGAGGVHLDTLSTAAGGAGNGLLMNNAVGSGSVTIGSGTLVTSVRGVDVNGGTNDVTVGAALEPTGGRSVEVTGHAGGTVDINGAVNEDATGINLTSNSGTTVRFDGGLTASTGASPAFTATGGGTVVVTGSANTLSTTTGTALNVANTTIGAAGLTFRSISSNGAPNGIVLNNTGASGGLTVSGNGGACTSTGSACTGGTVQSSAGDAVSLTTTRGVQLNLMKVINNGGNGVRGSSVTNLVIRDSVVDNNGDDAATDEAGLHLTNLGGNAEITRTLVANSPEDNARIVNSSGTLSQLDVTDSTFRDTDTVSPGNNGLLIQADGGSITADLLGNTFLRNRANGVQVITNGTGSMNVEIDDSGTSASSFDDNNIGVNLAHNSSGSYAFGVRDLTIDGINVAPGTGGSASPININLAGSATSPMVGRVTGNTLTNSNSTTGPGIRMIGNGTATLTANVESNTITQVANRGIEVIARDGSNRINATIANNSVTLNNALSADAIRVDAGAISTDTTTICADIRGNTATTTAAGLFGIRVRQRFAGTSFILEDYAGGPTDDAAVQTFLATTNSGATTSADHAGAGFTTTADCPNAP